MQVRAMIRSGSNKTGRTPGHPAAARPAMVKHPPPPVDRPQPTSSDPSCLTDFFIKKISGRASAPITAKIA